MKIFTDASAILKKYVLEAGSEALDNLIEHTTDIAVSPTCLLEMHSALNRRVKEKTLLPGDVNFVVSEIKKDFKFFNIILWTQTLEDLGVKMIQKHGLRSLDAVVLSAGKLANTDLFVTSDKGLYQAARKELKEVRLIV
ncbi:MAG: type II toxin-antitoxin system VapC family toxin [Candidatus Omnitrophota bacterium]